MKSLKIFSVILCLGIVLSGCSNTAKGTAIGAGGGAVAGAIIGKLLGNAYVGAAIGGAVGAGTGALIGAKMDKAKKAAQQVQNANVETFTDANGLTALRVTFDGGILFDTNKSDVKADAKASLSKFATDVLKANTDMDVAILGHTDNTGSDAVNNPLSEKRANSVKSYLMSQGATAKQMKTVQGCGSQMPVADNATAEGRAQNRRVEIYLYASQEMIEAANNGTLK